MLDFPQIHHNSTLLMSITPTSPQPAWYYTARPALFPWCSDKIISIAAPTVVYWVFSLMFHALDVLQLPYFEKRRIHESEEVLSRNKVTIVQVIKAVLWQQVVQTLLGVWWLEDDVPGSGLDILDDMVKLAPKVATGTLVLLGPRTGETVLRNHGQDIVRWVYWWGIPLAQMWFSFFIIDTWQYTLHRLCHTYHFLYRHFHSVHHRLYVPYAFGALYNHPVEGLVLDSVGAVLAEQLAGLSIRQAALLFAISSAKTVDDHCGYRIWWDPCQMFFYNNADYHDIHHQSYGIKANFSQPFFTNWDFLLGTHMSREEAEKRTRRSVKVEKVE